MQNGTIGEIAYYTHGKGQNKLGYLCSFLPESKILIKRFITLRARRLIVIMCCVIVWDRYEISVVILNMVEPLGNYIKLLCGMSMILFVMIPWRERAKIG